MGAEYWRLVSGIGHNKLIVYLFLLLYVVFAYKI
jgi:hypothetical protein